MEILSKGAEREEWDQVLGFLFLFSIALALSCKVTLEVIFLDVVLLFPFLDPNNHFLSYLFGAKLVGAHLSLDTRYLPISCCLPH